MKAEALLSRCDKVRSTGNGTWIACCPAHEDKTPSMTVRELSDGRVLVHCFGGCEVDQILSAVGLGFDALFPDRSPEDARAIRAPFPAADVLAALASELEIIIVIAGDMLGKRTVPEEDFERLRIARRRFEASMPYALGLHLRSVRNAKR